MSTCQICAREIKAKNGLIAHHGYERPVYRSGWQTASCLGARGLPYEVSADLLPGAINIVSGHVLRLSEDLARLASKPPVANPRHASWLNRQPSKRVRSDGSPIPEPPLLLARIEPTEAVPYPDNYEYDQTYQSLHYHTKLALDQATEQLAFLEHRLGAWVAPGSASEPTPAPSTP